MSLGPRPTQTLAGYPPLSRQRLAVLEFVRMHAPVRVSDTATGLELHPNTVREHLEALTHTGLVDAVTEKPTRRGRPAALYRPTPTDPAVPAHDYAGLAGALAGHLARTSTDPEGDARAAGIEWGRELVGELGGPSDGESTDTADPRRQVLDILSRLGFGPDAEGTDDPSRGIALRTCPLLAAARRYPSVVCQVHLGIVEGVLQELRASTGPGLDLVSFAEPGACRLFLPDPVVTPGVDHG